MCCSAWRAPVETICAECGASFVPRRSWQAFCSDAHRRAFHSLQAKRGSVAAPFLAAHNRTRAEDADSKALRAYAQTSLSELDRMWRAEDRAAKRRPDLLVRGKMEAGWKACDLDREQSGTRATPILREADTADGPGEGMRP